MADEEIGTSEAPRSPDARPDFDPRSRFDARSSRRELGWRKPLRRVAVLLVELLGAVVGVAALAIIIVGLRLEIAPLDISFAQPQLVARVNREIAPYQIAVEQANLRLRLTQGSIEIATTNPALRDGAGQLLLSSGRAFISLALPALLHGVARPTRIELERTHLMITRQAGGEFVLKGFPFVIPPPAPTLRQSGSWNEQLTALLDSLGGASLPEKTGSSGVLGHLRRVALSHSEISFEDKILGGVFVARDMGFAYERGLSGFTLTLNGLLALGDQQSGVSFSAHYRKKGILLPAKLDVAATLGGFNPAEWLAKLQAPPPGWLSAAKLRLPLSARLQGSVDLANGQLGRSALAVSAGAGSVLDGFFNNGALSLHAVDVAAHFEPDKRLLSLDRGSFDLQDQHFELHGRVHELSGISDVLGGKAMPYELDVGAPALPIARLNDLWPKSVAMGARDWIKSNLSLGVISQFGAQLNGKVVPGDANLSVDKAKGSMKLHGFTVIYLAGLPPVNSADAVVSFNQDQFEFNQVAGSLKDLRLAGGHILISGLQRKDQIIEDDFPVRGPVADVIDIMARDRLKLAQKAGLSPSGVSGSFEGTLHIRHPLLKDLPMAQFDYAADLRLSDLFVKGVVLGRDLSEGEMHLVLTKKLVTLSGPAKLDGNPGTLDWSQRVESDDPVKMKAAVKVTLDDASRKRLSLDVLPEVFSGPVGVDAVYTEFPERKSSADVKLDLAATAITVSALDYRKPAGAAGTAHFDVVLQDGHLVSLEKLEIEAPGLLVDGDFSFGPGSSFRRGAVARLRVSGNELTGSIDRIGEAWDVKVKGTKLDLTDYLTSLKNSAKPSPRKPPSGPPIHVDMQIEHLLLGKDRWVDEAALDVQLAQGSVERVRFGGVLRSGKRADLTLDPPEQGGKLFMRSDDLGALFQAAGIADNIKGGTLLLTGENHRANGERIITGHFEGSGYRLYNAPAYARLLSLTSPTTVVSLLRGGGMPFQVLQGDIKIQDGIVTITDALAHGGALGATAEGTVDMNSDMLDIAGTVIPAYVINSSLSKIPLIGDVLTGGNGNGVFAVNYRVSGPLSHVEVSVNPLSAFAPGILRKFFLFKAPASSATP